MKAVEIKLNERGYYLAFNGEAMFKIQEDFGGSENLIDILKQNTRESFVTLCEVVAFLAEQGELVRRYMGYDPNETLKSETIKNSVQPSDIFGLKLAVARAIALGYGREIDPSSKDEIDLGLNELKQKKTP